ncbi:MAG: hypothetical protein QG670_2794 [Thermoproteota archaeon]|nr:hypothetical protein [Thermoproteota archaeon]
MHWREILLTKLLCLLSLLRLSGISLLRATAVSYPFTSYFKGFEKVKAVRCIFGEDTEKVLGSLRVDFTPMAGYMGVNELNGHLIVNPHYLKDGDRFDVYLDVIHELVHVRQHREGKELFDSNYDYIDRPTEVEAYRHAVVEARRLKMSDERICEYLKTPWISDEDLKRLAKSLGVKRI